ncbi:MAG: hypothetical protein R2771_05220 [Saprospiraceae bacterium]
MEILVLSMIWIYLILNEIEEFISNRWYDYDEGKDAGLHPCKRRNSYSLHSPKPPFDHLM